MPMRKTSTLKRKLTVNSMRLRQRRPQPASRQSSVVEQITEEGNSIFYGETVLPLNPSSDPLHRSVQIPSLENSYVSATW